MGFFNKANQVISYTVDKNFSGNLSISIINGEVSVSVPWYVSNKKINKVICDKKKWILKKIAEYDEKNKLKKDIIEKDTVKVFGITYNLKIFYDKLSRINFR